MAGVCPKSGPASAANASGFLQTSLSEVTGTPDPARSSTLTGRVTPDRVLAFRANPARISTCGIGKRWATTRGLKQDRIQDDPARTEVRVGVFARRDYFLFADNLTLKAASACQEKSRCSAVPNG
jgi:hypothetical protein